MLMLTAWQSSANDWSIMINPKSIAAIYRITPRGYDADYNEYPPVTQVMLNNGTAYDVTETIDEISAMLEQAK
jgi:hypothetical protein